MEKQIQTQVEILQDGHQFSEEEKLRVQEILKGIDVNDSQTAIIFGANAQKQVSEFNDKVIGLVKAKDSGETGAVLTELMFKVKEVNVDNLTEKQNPLGKLPFLGSLFNKAKKFFVQYEKISTHIERITAQLEGAKTSILSDIQMLDTLFSKNKDYLNELSLYITAGELKLLEIRETLIPELQQKADASKDAEDIQSLNDLANFAERFEKKLHDLKLSRTIAIQSLPQIRLIQNNNQILADKIQSSILNTIPLWKQQMVVAITLFRQKNAIKIQKEVTNTTNELLKKNSELMKQGSIEIAKENERSIIDIETLRKTHSDLIFTLEETLKIQEEGRVKRAEVEKELVKMEAEIKEKINNFSNRS